VEAFEVRTRSREAAPKMGYTHHDGNSEVIAVVASRTYLKEKH
jgi:hypothetical protein